MIFFTVATATATTVLVTASCAQRSELRSQPPTPATELSPAWTPPTEGAADLHPDHPYWTDRELIRESDLIIIGTVEESVVGEVFPEGDEYPTRTIHTTVAVEETLKGPASTEKVTVPTQELGFTGAEVDWRLPGNRVLLFLMPSPERDEPFYILENRDYWQATYLVYGDDLEPGVAPHIDMTGVSDRVAKMTVPELRAFVDEESKGAR